MKTLNNTLLIDLPSNFKRITFSVQTKTFRAIYTNKEGKLKMVIGNSKRLTEAFKRDFDNENWQQAFFNQYCQKVTQ